MQRRIVGVIIGLSLTAGSGLALSCKREVPVAPPQPVDQTATVPAPLPATPTAAEVPVAVTPAVVAPAAPTPTLPDGPTVALYISAGPKGDQPLPTAGQPATMRVTPVGPDGRPLAELEPVLGSLISLLVLRADLGHVALVPAPKLSDPNHKSHDFKLTFPTGGQHVVVVLFKPKDQPVAAVPAFLNIQGPATLLSPASATSLTHAAKDGLQAVLGVAPQALQVCQPVAVASTWTKKGKPLPVAGPVLYFGVQAGRATLAEAAVALPDGATPAGDPGTAASFRFSDPGLVHVLAVVQLPGQKAGQAAIARFVVQVEGKPQPDGCPK
jgi:hypothetical protein